MLTRCMSNACLRRSPITYIMITHAYWCCIKNTRAQCNNGGVNLWSMIWTTFVVGALLVLKWRCVWLAHLNMFNHSIGKLQVFKVLHSYWHVMFDALRFYNMYYIFVTLYVIQLFAVQYGNKIYISIQFNSNIVSWEPEGCYRHRLCTAIAPFWFSSDDILVMMCHVCGK